MNKRPTVGIFKFTGCAGCQLELLHLEDVFLDLLKVIDITYWMMVKRENIEGPWDISFVDPEEVKNGCRIW
jgi:coenzyme F420-reducing hydrogenase gamma subunit